VTKLKKISPFLIGVIFIALAGSVVIAADNGRNDNSRYIVKYKAGKSQAALAVVKQNGGNVERSLSRHDSVAISMPAGKLNALRNNPNIEFVEDDVKRYPLAQTVPYGIPMVQADQLSDDAAGNTKVCIIDSGYELVHEDLSGNNVNGSNDSGTGDWYIDNDNHGTHVAGIISAMNNSVGVTGVMPNGKVPLHIVKVFGADGWAYSSGLVAALDVCIDNNADVINMSLGGPRSSRWERTEFQAAYDAGILSIAAAGNDGNTRHSYPASYDSVVSVAAIDLNKVVADFSQQTNQVELAAPGVNVLSSVPTGTVSIATLDVAGTSYDTLGMYGSPQTSATGNLVDCGAGESTCSGASGKMCLIQRGNINFSDKVLACETGGGIGAIIYNNEPGPLNGTLDGVATTIPSVGVSDTDGTALIGLMGSLATISLSPTNYALFDGTSMATPHIAGVAALVWSYFPACTASDVRNALTATAEDLGVMGRDNAYGFGLVQANDAVDYLATQSCAGATPTNDKPTSSFTFGCTNLACDFDGSNSSDSDGSIAGYSWSFGGSSVTASNTFAASGTYTASLIVTDNEGASHTSTQNVTVDDGSGNITLNGTRSGNLRNATLNWSGATGTNVDVYINGSFNISTANDGTVSYRGLNRKSSYLFQICETGSVTSCSNEITL
jgi:subtilisin family serine protease